MPEEDELRAHSVANDGGDRRAPRHAMLESCLHRVVELLQEPFDPNIKVAAASMLQAYSNVAMDTAAEQVAILVAHAADQVREIVGTASDPLLERGRVYALSSWTLRTSLWPASTSARRDGCMTIAYSGAISVLVGFRRGLCQRRAGMLDAGGGDDSPGRGISDAPGRT